MIMDINKINNSLKTGSYESQIEALNNLLELISNTSDILIDCLENAQDKLFISERIYLIEGMLSKKLQDKFDSTENIDLKLNIALILFKQEHTSNRYKDFLIELLQNENWSLTEAALFKLRQANIKEIIPNVIKKLEEIDLKNLNQLEVLIETLNHFKIELPKRIKDLSSNEDTPFRIKAAINNP